MAPVDALVALLAVAAALRGWRRGLLDQAFEFGGAMLGLVAGIAVGPRIASRLGDSAGLEAALVSLAIVLLGLSVGQVAGYALGRHWGTLARRARLGGADAALGSVFGIGVVAVAYWLLGSLLILGPIPEVARQLRRSEVLRTLNGVAEPPNVLAGVRQYLDASGFPQVFARPPRVSAPVDPPQSGVARRAYRSTRGSTVRVAVAACGGNQLGSGWIAAARTVVTNAHVVAGGDDVTVHDLDGAHPGTVVVFDPEEDVAILRVEGLEGDPLPLERRRLERGASGATLGYPGGAGGELRAYPAAVQRRFVASGYDIYGSSVVRREVYELAATVRQGDSGGPFVRPDGTVAGVVFAASTTDAGTGYALTGAEVADEIRRGTDATEPVDTGGCTH